METLWEIMGWTTGYQGRRVPLHAPYSAPRTYPSRACVTPEVIALWDAVGTDLPEAEVMEPREQRGGRKRRKVADGGYPCRF